MPHDAGELFSSLVNSGFEHVTGAQLLEIADYLDRRAANTGVAATLFVSEAIRGLHGFFMEHDEYGGIRNGFISELSDLMRDRLRVIQESDAHWAAKLAQAFRDEIRQKIASYDPRNSYD